MAKQRKVQLSGGEGPGLLRADVAGDLEVSDDYYNKEEVDALVAGANFNFFFSNTPDGTIGGYDLMYPTDTGEPESTAAASLVAIDTLIQTFITETFEPTFTTLAGGVYDIHLHAAKTAGIKGAVLYGEFYTRASGGSETLRATSDLSGSLTGSNIAYDLHFSVTSDIPLVAGDRLVVKIYGNPTGSGTDPTATLYLEGTNASRFEGKTVGSSELDQANVFYVSPAKGSNSNEGKNRNAPLGDWGEAFDRIEALTGGDIASLLNPWRVKFIGAGVITGDDDIPEYVTVDADDYIMSANVTGGNFSVLNCRMARGNVAGGFVLTKRAAAGPISDVEPFVVNVREAFVPYGSLLRNLGNASSGPLVFNGVGIDFVDFSLITATCTGPVNFYLSRSVATSGDTTATPQFVFGGSATHIIDADIDDNFSNGTVVTATAGTPTVYFRNNSMTASSRPFWNVTTPNINYSTTTFSDSGSTTANTFVKGFEAAKINNYTNFFADLTTAPQSIGTLTAGSQYLIRIKTPAINSGHLTLGIEHNGTTYDFTTVAQLQSNAVNMGIAGAPGSYGITVGGYTPTFALNINTTTGAATIQTQSGTATGQTEVRVVKITP